MSFRQALTLDRKKIHRHRWFAVGWGHVRCLTPWCRVIAQQRPNGEYLVRKDLVR